MPDKLLACRTASLLALVLLLLTGCFISAEPLIPTVDIVTPLPVEFSAVQLDKNGKMVLPDQSKGPKAPDIEHLKLVSGRYVRDNGRPNILTFAKLDDSGTNFLLQVADASSGGSVVYAIARVSGQTLAIYGLAAPDGGPEGATKALLMNTTGYFGFQADATYHLEPIEQFMDVIRLGCGRDTLEPAKRRHAYGGIEDE